MAGALSALMSSMVMTCCCADTGNPCRDARSVQKGFGLLASVISEDAEQHQEGEQGEDWS